MSILINTETKIIVQGMTGTEGTFHTRRMKAYGSKIVAGVTPGKSGNTVDGIPVFNTVNEAVQNTGADVSVIFVPAAFAKDAILEAASARLRLAVCITEGVPTLDVIEAVRYVEIQNMKLIGPNSPGLITPGEALIGIMPGNTFIPGPVGVISRSGTLTYEVVNQLTMNGIGQSTCIGVGGDPVIGMRFLDCLKLFENDKNTKAVVMVGEIGGTDEVDAALYIKEMTKPVVSFISGLTAPPGKRMGHAGAIISGGKDTAQSKVTALKEMGIPVAKDLSEIPRLVKEALN
jgi:succinyl-CoA synthetase alpha subunit